VLAYEAYPTGKQRFFWENDDLVFQISFEPKK
jgi:hypothetical protein